jgi:hypothetical protein
MIILPRNLDLNINIMKILQHNFNKWVFLFTILFALSGCSDDDDNAAAADTTPQPEAWEIEVNELKAMTSQYVDFAIATDEGRIDVSGYVPYMGHHYLNLALADGTFEINKPEIILYVPDENDVMQMVAIEYSIIPDDPNNPGNPPEGFTGDEDVWHFNDNIGQWQLHVWTIIENPAGIFASQNPVIGG